MMSQEKNSAGVPTLAFSLHDLAVLAEVIRAYLVYANIRARRCGMRPAYLTILQRLYERFSSVSPRYRRRPSRSQWRS
jgi:hypothetical protein